MVDSELLCDWFNDRRALNFAATLKPGVDPKK